MSNSELGKLVRSKWAEVLVCTVVGGMAWQLWNFNREVGVLGAGLQSLESRMGRLESALDRIDTRLEKLAELPAAIAVLGERVNGLARDVSNIRVIHQTNSIEPPPQ